MNKRSTLLQLIVLLLIMSLVAIWGCGKKSVHRPSDSQTTASQSRTPSPSYTVMGQTYTPIKTAANYKETGIASWYGKKFHGRLTASGEVYNMYQRTAAHRILPMQTWLVVTNLDNNKTTRVRVNDRGPFVKNRILDLSYQAAKELGMIGPGTARVRIEAANTSPAGAPGPFYIQVGSFTQKDNARHLCRTLRHQGYAASRIHPITLDGTTYWRVHAGVFTSLGQARQAMTTLSRRFPACFMLAD